MGEDNLDVAAGARSGMWVVGIIIYVAIIVFMIASAWKVYAKAGKPGWAALVPVYNIIVTLQIIGKPMWWILLLLLPIANFIGLILISLEMAKVFGKGAGFGVGLILLPFIFYPILAFSDAQYKEPAKA